MTTTAPPSRTQLTGALLLLLLLLLLCVSVCVHAAGFVRVRVDAPAPQPQQQQQQQQQQQDTQQGGRHLLGSLSGGGGSGSLEGDESTRPFDLNPVILVPGLMGSALETKVSSPSNCAGMSDWSRTWVALGNLWGGHCWMSNLARSFDGKTGTFTPPHGVETRVLDFGGVSGIDYLGRSGKYGVPGTSYMSGLVQKLVAAGYQVGKNLFGAPYDWRSTPTTLENEGYYKNLKTLIEKTRSSTGRRVHLVAHSMGAPYTLYFLNKVVDAKWKEQNIANLISLSGAFAGAPEALRAVLSGDSDSFVFWGLHLLRPLDARLMEATGGGFQFLIPFRPPGLPEGAVWPDTEVLGTVQMTNSSAPPRSFSFQDLDALVQLGVASASLKTNEETRSMAKSMEALWQWMRNPATSPHQYVRDPGVPMYCLYGDNMATQTGYAWPSPDFDQSPLLLHGDGDGTVPADSLRVCHHWPSTQFHEAHPVSHSDMVSDAVVLGRVESILRLTAHMGRPVNQGSSYLVWVSVSIAVLFVALVGIAIVQQLANRRMRRVVESAGGYINMNAIGMVRSHHHGPQPFSLSQKYAPYSTGYEGGDL